MKRLTRRIGVFGGAGSMMSAIGGKSSVPAAPTVKPKTGTTGPAAPEEPPRAEEPKKKSWLGRLFGGDEEK
jgi:hypothetical protein